MHEQGFAGGELAALEHVVPDGEESLRNRGGLDHRKTCRHRQRVACKSQAIFGVTPADHERHQFVALVPARHARADLCDLASDFQSGNFHGLRHTWASHAVMNGVPLLVVAKNLGHRDTTMVERHYGHMAEDYVVKAIRADAPRFGTPSSVVPLPRGKSKRPVKDRLAADIER